MDTHHFVKTGISDPAYLASRAIDNDPATFYNTDDNSNAHQWMEVDFGETLHVQCIELTGRSRSNLADALERRTNLQVSMLVS